METLGAFYRGKNVLITGHTGFKGGWMSVWLKKLGANVTGFALPPDTNPNLFRAASVDRDITSLFGDIRNPAEVQKAFENGPEIVIHNAAQPLVRRSYREPVETYATNVMGTVHVLDAARRTASVRSLVVVTSDKCYENREWSRGYSEEDAMGGFDPYSSSKGCAELVTAAYRLSFFHHPQGPFLGSARAGNVIGGGDWSEDRLIPDIVRGITTKRPVIIRRPDSVRPWQHVLEPVRGYLMLAKRLWEGGEDYASGWNFGPSEKDAATVCEIARQMVEVWGTGELQVRPDQNAPHEAQYLRLNCKKAEEYLGWRPVLGLGQTLQWTIEWYRSFYDDPASARAMTESQIERYTEMSAA